MYKIEINDLQHIYLNLSIHSHTVILHRSDEEIN